MIDANLEETPKTEEKAVDMSNRTVVTQVTVEMILGELAMGVTREEMVEKFAYKDAEGTIQPFEKWMIDEIFKDPALKGKRPSKKNRKRLIPFTFVGTVEAQREETFKTPLIQDTTEETEEEEDTNEIEITD
jgi:hypothetical protein